VYTVQYRIDGNRLAIFSVVLAAAGVAPVPLVNADEFERPPIEYSKAPADNCITRLQQQLEQGETEFDYDEQSGYLMSLLAALGVPVESQTLVFSKTSLQRSRISPHTPRAIYFNDEVYIGFCQSGDVLEISAVDSKLGAVFYTLDQHKREKPHFTRQTDRCLICHSSSRTDGVPGHVVRSLFVDPAGQPILSEGSNIVDHTTPLSDRWGGWYVTGKHGDQDHLGNLIIRGRDVPRPVENEQGQNVTELADRFAGERYLSPHSDIVALMVLEHQALVHNRLTKASNVSRQALHYEAALNKALGEPADRRLESTTGRIQSAGDDLVEAMLMVDEAKLTAPVEGTSGFAKKFSQQGPRDSHGRSLRDFDLRRRMFKYPCSCLIYSRAFDELPSEMRDYVWRRLWQVLVDDEDATTFAHVSGEDKRAIFEIIRQTKDGLPEYWKAADAES